MCGECRLQGSKAKTGYERPRYRPILVSQALILDAVIYSEMIYTPAGAAHVSRLTIYQGDDVAIKDWSAGAVDTALTSGRLYGTAH